MVHIPSAYTYNFWAKSPTEVVELTCLMPNGVVIPFETNRNITLAEIKEVSSIYQNITKIYVLLLVLKRIIQ